MAAHDLPPLADDAGAARWAGATGRRFPGAWLRRAVSDGAVASLDGVAAGTLDTYDKLGVPLGTPSSPASRSTRCSTRSRWAPPSGRLADRRDLLFVLEAVHPPPELVRKYLGSVVPTGDNFYATLNSAVFSDGSFMFIPGRALPDGAVDLLRINAQKTGRFERTLIVAENGAAVSYLEGCTAPQRDEHQLHAAVVELVATTTPDQIFDGAELVPGRREGPRRHLQLRDQARAVRRRRSRIAWTQVETGSAITWKYPSVVLRGDNSRSGSIRSR